MHDWDQWDHAARLLYRLRRANLSSASGLFYGKALSDEEVNAKLWALMRQAELKLAPSRQERMQNKQRRQKKTPMSKKTGRALGKASTDDDEPMLDPQARTGPNTSAPVNPDEIDPGESAWRSPFTGGLSYSSRTY